MAKRLKGKEERKLLIKVRTKIEKEEAKIKKAKIEYIKRAFPSRATGKKRLKKLKAVPTRLKGTKQPKFATAATKLTSAFLPPGALTGAAPSTGAVDSGRGRGRPSGTFKARYVPGVGVVRVPTHVYKKMISAAKAKQRLAAAQRQAQMQQQAEQIAMQTDPRFDQSGEDEAFLQEPDMEHQERVDQMRQQQMQQQMQQAQQRAPPQQFQQQHATLGSKLRSLIRGNRPSKFGEFQEQPQTSPQQFQQPQQMFTQGGVQRQNTVNPNLHRPANPQVRILGKHSNILNAPSLFGKRGGPIIGFGR